MYTNEKNKYLDCGEARSAFIMVSASVGAVDDALLAGLPKQKFILSQNTKNTYATKF